MEAAGKQRQKQQVCSVRQTYTPQFAEGGTLRLMGISCSNKLRLSAWLAASSLPCGSVKVPTTYAVCLQPHLLVSLLCL